MEAERRAAKTRVPPAHPELARRKHIAGTVKMEVDVDPEGQVQDVKVVTGHACCGMRPSPW
jgi:outer membrane biosynthesis protein TonB